MKKEEKRPKNIFFFPDAFFQVSFCGLAELAFPSPPTFLSAAQPTDQGEESVVLVVVVVVVGADHFSISHVQFFGV